MEDLCIPWTLQSFNWQVRSYLSMRVFTNLGTYGKIDEVK